VVASRSPVASNTDRHDPCEPTSMPQTSSTRQPFGVTTTFSASPERMR
jgi:hypothetical protein